MSWQWSPWLWPHIVFLLLWLGWSVVLLPRLGLRPIRVQVALAALAVLMLLVDAAEAACGSLACKSGLDDVQHGILLTLTPILYQLTAQQEEGGTQAGVIFSVAIWLGGLISAGLFIVDGFGNILTIEPRLSPGLGGVWLEHLQTPLYNYLLSWSLMVGLVAAVRLSLALLRTPPHRPYQYISFIALAVFWLVATGLSLVGLQPWLYERFTALALNGLVLIICWSLPVVLEWEDRLARRWEAFEKGAEIYLVLDQKGLIREASSTVFRYIDVRRNELLGQPLSAVWPALSWQIPDMALLASPGVGPDWEAVVGLEENLVTRRFLARRSWVQRQLFLPYRAGLSLRTTGGQTELEDQLGRLGRELVSSRSITEAMLSLESRDVIMDRVAQYLCANLGLEAVWAAAFDEPGASITWLAYRHSLTPRLAAGLLSLLGTGADNQLPSQALALSPDDHPVYRGLLQRRETASASLADFFAPWSPLAHCQKITARAGLRSALAVPVLAGSRPLGLLLAASRSSELSPYQHESLRRTAINAAVVLENHRLQTEHRRRAEELERSHVLISALAEVAAVLPISADPQVVMEAVGSGLRRLNLTCYFADYASEGETLRMRYMSIQPHLLEAAEKLAGLSRLTYRLPVKAGPLKSVLEARRTIFVPDVAEFSVDYLPSLPVSLAHKVYALVGIPPGTPGAYAPIILDEGLVGVFGVWGGDLRIEDLDSLAILANQVSAALRNGRLIEQEKRRAQAEAHARELLAALGQVASALPLTADPDKVMATIGSELRKLELTCFIAELEAESGGLRPRYISLDSHILQSDLHQARGQLERLLLRTDREPVFTVVHRSSPVFVEDALLFAPTFLPTYSNPQVINISRLVGVKPGTAAACAPLRLAGQVVGLMAVWGPGLQANDLPAVATFAAQVASALSGVRMFEQTSLRAKNLTRANALIAALSQAAANFRIARTPQQVLNIAGRELKKLGLECQVAEHLPGSSELAVRFLSIEPDMLRSMEKLVGLGLDHVRLPAGIYPAKEVLVGQTVFIEDIQKVLAAHLTFIPASVFSRALALAGVQPETQAVWIPLSVQGKFSGLISIWGKDIQREDVPTLGVFANQVSVALENALLHEDASLQLQRQELLRTAAQAWHASLDFQAVIHSLVEQFSTALDVTSAYLCDYDLSTGLSTVLAEYYTPAAAQVERVSDVGKQYDYYALAGRKLASDILQYHPDSPLISPAEKAHLLEYGCQSVLVAPLEVRGRLSFYLELWESRTRRVFSRQELELCQDMARTASLAIDNARLYRELQQRLQERHAVQSAAAVVLDSQDLSEVTTRLAETLGRAIDATSAYFVFYDLDSQTYSVVAEYISEHATEKERESDLGKPYDDDTSSLIFMLLQGEPVLQHTGEWSLNPEYVARFAEFQVQSALFLPLILASGGLIGYIEVWETRRKREFSQAEMRLCQAIAQQASIAIDKSRLYLIAQQEISGRALVEARLRQSEQEYRSLFENAHDAILIFDPTSGGILEVNPRACEMYGYERHELLGLPVSALSADAQAEMLLLHDTSSQDGEGLTKAFSHRTIHRRKDGGEMYLDINGVLVWYAGRQAVQSIHRDITEQVRAEERLRFEAFHDGLTGLPNRALLLERLERSIAHYRRQPERAFAVLFLDLDRFKNVNDSRGHFLGDRLLVQVALRLQESVRAVDTVARLSGDEFVVLMEDIQEILDASVLCERILVQLRKPFILEGDAIYTSTSIGVVMSDPAYASPENYLRDADIAMYRAKAAGRDRFEVFDADMREQVIQRLALENDLRQALEQEQFKLYYMPIISLESGEVVGLEALLRWQHPNRGLVAPLTFIPIAEETGLILPLGEWVLNQACQQMQAWRQRFQHTSRLAVNVNLSGEQLSQGNLVAVVRSAIQKSGLPASCLSLEVTESALIRDVQDTLRLIQELKALGVSVQLDDFGTCYSALSYLRQFPIDVLKIDRSFMGGYDGLRKAPDLVRAIVLMGRELGIDVVAEGVETEEQRDFLLSVRCTYGQGYYFAPPMESSSAAAYLLEHLPAQDGTPPPLVNE